MNKKELVAAIAEKAAISKPVAEKALNAFVETVEETLKKGDDIRLVGFGTFEVRERKARKAQNPQTKEEITIPATKVPAFKAGKGLKDVVAQKN